MLNIKLIEVKINTWVILFRTCLGHFMPQNKTLDPLGLFVFAFDIVFMIIT